MKKGLIQIDSTQNSVESLKTFSLCEHAHTCVMHRGQQRAESVLPILLQ